MPAPDLSDVDYTIRLPHEDVCELIAGRVPQDVVVLLIGLVNGMQETPAEFVTKPKRRRQTQTEAA